MVSKKAKQTGACVGGMGAIRCMCDIYVIRFVGPRSVFSYAGTLAVAVLREFYQYLAVRGAARSSAFVVITAARTMVMVMVMATPMYKWNFSFFISPSLTAAVASERL